MARRVWLLVGLLAACQLAQTTAFQLTIPVQAEVPALPVALEDRTGLVLQVGSDVNFGGLRFSGGVTNLPGQPNVIGVVWTTGACSIDSAMLFERVAGGYRLSVRTRERQAACEAIGYPRTLALQLAAPIDASTIDFVESLN